MSPCPAHHLRLTREDIRQIQLERLQSTLHRVRRRVAFYKQRFQETGFNPDQFESLDDMVKLPFTTEQDLSDAYPYDMFCIPLRDVVRIHTTTGRGNSPIVIGNSERDLTNRAKLLARVYTSIGLTSEDVFQITLRYGLGTGAFSFHDAAREIGASTIPTSVGHTDKQLKIMRDFGTSCLIATPGYARILLEAMESRGMTPSMLRLKAILLTGEPWSTNLAADLEQGFQAPVYDIYGLSAVCGPGIAAQCQEKTGLHLQEDMVYAEIIDPQSGKPVAPGQWGELVLTTLVEEAVPVIRYRTGDRARLLTSPCACGSTFRLLDHVPGRIDDVLIVKGINIAPEMIERVLTDVLGTAVSWKAEVTGEGPTQQLVLRIGITEPLFFDQMKRQRAMVDRLRHAFAQWIGVTPRILLVEPQSVNNG
ncbi:phenylacetate--CoA ligase family protein [Desulfoplanes formicivorans]|uniref:Phenylacetate-CoA ligase n=1 Tax=Desulfoplanes formicivorans TaxID=1592317 RepID=A0A194AIC4_9BACT|nr:AMP-binding protein [Desulfoplanes formicivorans]GAU09078.1 phenylacetate-CoA ligase [Desulfoplanes formicivorans]